MTSIGGSLPAVNQLVSLRMACCGALPHASRVEDVSDTALLVGAPLVHPAEEDTPVAGDHLLLSWTTPLGKLELRATFEDALHAPLTLWRLLYDGQVECIQRRNYVRVPVRATVDFLVGGPKPGHIGGTMIDLSEGGLRCVVRRDAGMVMADELIAIFELEDGGVETPACAVRSAPLSRDLLVIGIRFLGLSPKDQERIRRHVFQRQLELRRARL